jgi:hypothetical protein
MNADLGELCGMTGGFAAPCFVGSGLRLRRSGCGQQCTGGNRAPPQRGE